MFPSLVPLSLNYLLNNREMSMNWEALGAIGDLIGGVAVIATLIYLAVQIRQNTKSLDETRLYTKAQTFQARTDTALEVTKFRDHELMVKLGVLVMEDIQIEHLSQLNDMEKERLYTLLTAYMIAVDNVFYQRSLGLLGQVIGESHNFGNIIKLWLELKIPLRPNIAAAIQRRELQPGVLAELEKSGLLD